jgi:hypothetical protein
MKAAVGDRIVVVPRVVGGPARDARVVELRNADGSPPYVVEWSDTGQRTLYFPGSDGRLEHHEGEPPRSVSDFHVKTWRITVHVFEHGDDTTAHAVLRADAAEPVEARGAAHRHPADPEVPEIGDEVAVARALQRLADTLMGAASGDMAAAKG